MMTQIKNLNSKTKVWLSKIFAVVSILISAVAGLPLTASS
jgi:hypothetical protein